MVQVITYWDLDFANIKGYFCFLSNQLIDCRHLMRFYLQSVRTGRRFTRNSTNLEIVMNELRKNQNFDFDLQIPPTLPNGT